MKHTCDNPFELLIIFRCDIMLKIEVLLFMFFRIFCFLYFIVQIFKKPDEISWIIFILFPKPINTVHSNEINSTSIKGPLFINRHFIYV